VLILVTVEGIELKGKRIHEKQLIKAWKTLSNKPLPKISALKLKNEDFNHVIDLRRCPEDQIREIGEWGRILSTKGTDACVFNIDQNENIDYLILIRENPYHSLDEIIVHELSHIARGDL
jgi:hypothetical protein